MVLQNLFLPEETSHTVPLTIVIRIEWHSISIKPLPWVIEASHNIIKWVNIVVHKALDIMENNKQLSWACTGELWVSTSAAAAYTPHFVLSRHLDLWKDRLYIYWQIFFLNNCWKLHSSKQLVLLVEENRYIIWGNR